MVEKWSIPYPACTGEEPRNVYVYLPDGMDGRERLPVLYMFDGHNVFFDEDATYGTSWGMGAYMEETDTRMMIVAVECNHSPDNGRLSDTRPSPLKTRIGPRDGPGTGDDGLVHPGAQAPDRPALSHAPGRVHTFIAGSSMGGLMSLYAVVCYNRVFSRAAALSPSLWVAPKKLIQLVDEADIAPGTVVYMDYGAKEMRSRRHMRRAFASVSGRLIERRVLLTSRIIPRGEHTEASWSRQIPFFINTLLYEQP